MIEWQTDYDFVDHIEIIPGKIQAFKVKMYERNDVFMVYIDPMQMITPFSKYYAISWKKIKKINVLLEVVLIQY